jgi:hypothetical protein
MGTAKAVGDAVREGQCLEWSADSRIRRLIHCIGIAPWGIVKHRHELIQEDMNTMKVDKKIKSDDILEDINTMKVDKTIKSDDILEDMNTMKVDKTIKSDERDIFFR